MAKDKKQQFGPHFVAHVVKECMGEAEIDEEFSVDGNCTVRWGKKGVICTTTPILEQQEQMYGEGAAIVFIVNALNRGYGPGITYEPKLEEAAKEKGKRKLGKKAKEVDQALDIAGVESKEKDQILKNA